MLAIRCYDRFTSAGQVQFAGVALVVQGLVSIWAAEERSGWTFMTVACVGWALTLATYIRVLLANFAAWNKLVYIWGLMYGTRIDLGTTDHFPRSHLQRRSVSHPILPRRYASALSTSDPPLGHSTIFFSRPSPFGTHPLPGSSSACC